MAGKEADMSEIVNTPADAISQFARSMRLFATQGSQDLVGESGGLGPLIALLDCSVNTPETAREDALEALCALATTPANASVIRQASAIKSIVSMLSSPSQAATAFDLLIILAGTKRGQDLIRDANGEIGRAHV